MPEVQEKTPKNVKKINEYELNRGVHSEVSSEELYRKGGFCPYRVENAAARHLPGHSRPVNMVQTGDDARVEGREPSAEGVELSSKRINERDARAPCGR